MAVGVIQAPKLEPRIMRYELSDYEWTAIKPMLPNKPRGVRRVNDRRVLNGIFGSSPRRDRLVAAIVVEAALGVAAEPAGLDVFYQERAGPVLGVRETLMQDLHDRQTGIEADEIGKFKRPHRMVRTELHRGVDRLDVSDPLIQRIDRLVDHRQQNAIDDERRKILRNRDLLAEPGDELLGGVEGRIV